MELELREELMALRRKEKGPKHPATIEAINNLAWVLVTCPDTAVRNPTARRERLLPC